MNEFIENFKNDLVEIWGKIQEIFHKITGKKPSQNGNAGGDGNYEISLVPEVKAEAIKALRIRNLVLFICIVVSSVALGVVVVLFGIKSGQDIAMSNQDRRLEKMSAKLQEYTGLDDLTTIQSQLEMLNMIANEKTMLSRVFGALGVMMPKGGDDVSLSDLRVNLETNLITLEGQADARVAPLIDYRVLEAFKKGVDLTRYDYGRYVDIDGKEIPTQCIREADAEGNALRSGDSYYAWWDLTIPGCEGVVRSLTADQVDYHFHAKAETELAEIRVFCDTDGECEDRLVEITCDWDATEKEHSNCRRSPLEGEDAGESGMVEIDIETVETLPIRVKIWRTPQFDEWYDAGEMSLEGVITGIEHFNSMCYVYTGALTGEEGAQTVRWNSSNDCVLAPDGLTITGSSNGRDESDNLVLRFTATVTFAEEFFMFNNKHMIAIGPMGQNVTDSYVQIGNMFAKEAEACAVDDVECLLNGTNGGDN